MRGPAGKAQGVARVGRLPRCQGRRGRAAPPPATRRRPSGINAPDGVVCVCVCVCWRGGGGGGGGCGGWVTEGDGGRAPNLPFLDSALSAFVVLALLRSLMRISPPLPSLASSILL